MWKYIEYYIFIHTLFPFFFLLLHIYGLTNWDFNDFEKYLKEENNNEFLSVKQNFAFKNTIKNYITTQGHTLFLRSRFYVRNNFKI